VSDFKPGDAVVIRGKVRETISGDMVLVNLRVGSAHFYPSELEHASDHASREATVKELVEAADAVDTASYGCLESQHMKCAIYRLRAAIAAVKGEP